MYPPTVVEAKKLPQDEDDELRNVAVDESLAMLAWLGLLLLGLFTQFSGLRSVCVSDVVVLGMVDSAVLDKC